MTLRLCPGHFVVTLALSKLGPPVVPFSPLFWGGSPTKIDTTEKRWHQLILTSLLDLVNCK